MEDRKKLNRELIGEIKTIHHQMPRWIALIFLFSVFIFLAFRATSLLIILLLSGVLAYILSDIINKAESMGLKRNVAVIMLYLSSAGLIIGAEIILSPYLQEEIKNFYSQLPDFSQRLERVFTQRSPASTSAAPLTDEFIRKILSDVISPGLLINKTLNFSDIFSHAASFFLGLVLIPFFVFFLLKDWPRIVKTVMVWVPSAYVETTVSLLSEINILVGRYLRGLTLDCIMVTIIATCGLWLSGINYPISLGILTGAANVIPYLGPLIAGSAACLITFVQFDSIRAVVNIIFLYIMIRLLDDLVLQPVTIGKIVKLHPMLLVITIIIGHRLFGVIGMIVAVPFISATQKVFGILMERGEQTTTKKGVICIGNLPL